MKKAFVIGIFIIYNVIVTMGANDLSVAISGTPIPETPSAVGFNLEFLEDTLAMFWDLLTFTADGIPPVLIMFLFTIPNIVLLIILLALIFNRD